ncbi:MAG: ABC transporter substrate-binding protein [Alphaproteobacteria bacterium]|nr:MAG: ABC transporter substrate-binding protein [Alphaproteobacteria bacterium]
MRRILLAGAAVLATATAGTAEVKLGSLGGVTGPIAEIVALLMEGRELAARHVNEQGGLFADGQQLTLVVGDSACDPKAAVDAATKLVNVDQVVAIVGPNCSGATLAAAQSVTIPAGVVILSESATSPAITALDDKDLVFRAAPSDAYQGIALANYILGQGVKTVALTNANDDYNAGLAAEFAKAFEAAGGKIAAHQVHEPNKANYRAEVATLGGAKADALVVFAYYGSSGIAIIRNALETGAYSKFFGADGMVNDELVNQLGVDALKDAAFTTPGADDSTGAFKAYMELAKDLKQPLGPYVPNAYDATFLLALAIEKAGSADRSKIAAALREVATPPGEVILPGEWAKAKALIAEGKDINYEGATGSLDFDAAGDVPGTYTLNTVTPDGKFAAKLLK